uniref:TEA domain-containing protein n=1 Tax=Plectus sambesii TaxID=2011161 RepID=A0A914V4S4_9BILA
MGGVCEKNQLWCRRAATTTTGVKMGEVVGRRCDQMAVRGFFLRRLPRAGEPARVHAQENAAGRERRRVDRVYHQHAAFSDPMSVSGSSVDVVAAAGLGLMPSTSTDDGASSRSGGSPVEQKPTLWQVNGQQGVTQLSPTAADQAMTNESSAPNGAQPASTVASELSGDAEGVWSPDIDQAFQEALQIYPPCGRRKIILSDEGKMYGRNELIARYIKIRCGKTRTRKQVSSHIQVLARKKGRELQAKFKDQASKDRALQSLSQLSSAQIVSMSVMQKQNPFASHPQLGGSIPPGAAGFYGAGGPFWQPGLSPPGASVAGHAAGIPSVSATHHLPDLKFNPYPRLSSASAFNGGILPQFSNPMMSPAAMPTPSAASLAPAPPHSLIDDRSIASSKLTLCNFTAYVEPSVDGRQPHVDLVRIPRFADEPLESIKVNDIMEKYPDTLMELFEKGPSDVFFLVKCWANIHFNAPDDRSALYAVDSSYESPQSFSINVSTKVCSFGKQVVEKVEVDQAVYSQTDGRYHFCLERSPMCDYMVKFIAELKKLQSTDLMNSVLDNFTVLQVVTNKETRETLMVIAFIFEVSPEPESTCRMYRLVPDDDNDDDGSK